MESNVFKGYLFALISTLAFSNIYILSKAAMNVFPLAQFGSMWYTMVTIACLLFAIFNKKLDQLSRLSSRQIRVLITLGFLEILTTTFFFLSIHIIPDPSVTSFLGNMYPVMVMSGGIFILHERFGFLEIFGGFMALAGAFVISYTGGTTLQTLFIRGTGLVFINALFATSATLIAKKYIHEISPEILNLNRSVWLLVFSIVMFFVLKEQVTYSSGAFISTLIGGIIEFIGILTIYYSFHYIEASRSTIIQSLKGIFVLIGTWLFFHTFPSSHQFIGGMITVAGILIMTLAQAGIFSLKKLKFFKA